MNRLKPLATTFLAISALGLASCDKVKDLTDSAKSWFSDDEKEESDGNGQTTEVVSVDKKEGEEVIASESRLVMVEYYSDT
ncbi:MAG: hypothetical protein AB8F34_12580 [Akkermansiaceae bacterium]